MKFRKKPVVIEAFQWLGQKLDQWPIWVADYKHGRERSQVRAQQDGGLEIPTLEGVMLASRGDWIIKGVMGELYPCKPDIFEATYEYEPIE